MSSKYDFLKDVNPAKEDWRIKVKVVRTWKVPNFQRKNLEDNLEMVLLDEQGGRIHATVKDVIGLISGIGKVCDRVVSGRKTKMVVLELDDLRGHKLECTLWEHYVDEVQSFLADNDDPHNVLIVQLGRIKCFRGKVGITNTKYTTRIVMDSKLNEIVEFKKRLSIDGVESSTRMTQLSTQSSYSFENDFLKETEKKSISDVKLCVEVTTCITYGTIKAIESKYNWWYKSCKKCPFSVYEDFEKWYCKNCQKHWEDYYPRFSVQVRVVDNTDSASFILFDRDCVSLLGMSAAELRELHFKRGADLDQFPNELNVLNEKSMLFKINVKQKDLNTNSEPKYQVSKICISEDIISAFIKSLIDPNDEANFDNARENEVVSSELEKAA
ncbi:replication protein A 70 kDa DNA-binding subunit E-like, partial [Gastrolobium bilobum]|uniref:replication protein A 70 kDa DNA-binding subunit E-like n=1 Tax=Gastrolobium bilobum TaxID=150636 RepID=UPI002AB0ADBA